MPRSSSCSAKAMPPPSPIPRVVKAMTQGSRRRIALCFVEWADDYEQSVIVSWSLIEGAEDAHRFARPHSHCPACALRPHLHRRRHRLRAGAARPRAVQVAAPRHRRIRRRHQQCRAHRHARARRGPGPGRDDQRPCHPERQADVDQSPPHASARRARGLLSGQRHRRPQCLRGRGRRLRRLRPLADRQADQGDRRRGRRRRTRRAWNDRSAALSRPRAPRAGSRARAISAPPPTARPAVRQDRPRLA